MAKGYKKQTFVMASDNGKEPVERFVTSTGVELLIHGVPQLLLEKVRSSVKMPDPPTYTAKTVAGDEETHFHDETTLESDEDRKAWSAYLADKASKDAELRERMVRVILMRGTDVTLPEDESWKDLQRFIGVEVPDDPLELKYHYIQTEAVGGAQDLALIMEKVMEKTGIPEEALAEAKASFRNIMEKDNTIGEIENQ